MPSRPLSPDRHAITQLHTRIDVEAIAVTKGETGRGAAVARLATLVPPTRLDLVDEVMARIGTRKADRKDWPPYRLVCELVTRVKATHLAEVKLRGPDGETVEVVSYVDKMQTRRDVYRLRRHGRHVGDYKSVEDPGKQVDLATLLEDTAGSTDETARRESGDGPA
jgi:hypothetical protein